MGGNGEENFGIGLGGKVMGMGVKCFLGEVG